MKLPKCLLSCDIRSLVEQQSMDALGFLPWLWYDPGGPGAVEAMLIGGNSAVAT